MKPILMRLLPHISSHASARRHSRDGREYLEVPELSEPLATLLESAGKGLGPFMHNLVRTHVAPLRKSSSTFFARIWPFTRVSTLMCLD